MDQSPETKREGKPRGFAAMDRNRVRELASKGGVAAHALGKAHEFTVEQAREAGRKGGLRTHANKRAAKESVGDAGNSSGADGQTS